MQDISDKLIVALDVDTLEKAGRFVDILYPTVKLFKIGSQLFTAYGPEAVKMVGKKGGKVFLDLKFHDIPNTVFASTCSSIALGLEPITSEGHLAMFESGCVFMITVHTQGGLDAMKAATRGAEETSKELNIKKPYIVGVTVLTSDKQEDTAKVVLERASLAQQAGLDGVVCSAQEAAAVRKACGKGFIIVTPGIRPPAAAKDDQQRTATPREAIRAGSNFLVVGRPVLQAADPLKAVKELKCQK